VKGEFTPLREDWKVEEGGICEEKGWFKRPGIMGAHELRDISHMEDVTLLSQMTHPRIHEAWDLYTDYSRTPQLYLAVKKQTDSRTKKRIGPSMDVDKLIGLAQIWEERLAAARKKEDSAV